MGRGKPGMGALMDLGLARPGLSEIEYAQLQLPTKQ